jgi:hypothetical protein
VGGGFFPAAAACAVKVPPFPAVAAYAEGGCSSLGAVSGPREIRVSTFEFIEKVLFLLSLLLDPWLRVFALDLVTLVDAEQTKQLFGERERGGVVLGIGHRRSP